MTHPVRATARLEATEPATARERLSARRPLRTPLEARTERVVPELLLQARWDNRHRQRTDVSGYAGLNGLSWPDCRHKHIRSATNTTPQQQPPTVGVSSHRLLQRRVHVWRSTRPNLGHDARRVHDRPLPQPTRRAASGGPTTGATWASCCERDRLQGKPGPV